MTITKQEIERAREWWDNNAPLYSPADALAEYAVHVTADLRQQLAEKDSKIAALERVICGETSLIAVLADIREKSGLGAKPMLSDLAQKIGTKLAEKDAEIARLLDVLQSIAQSADRNGQIHLDEAGDIGGQIYNALKRAGRSTSAYICENLNVWRVPTAEAYAKTCLALQDHKEKLYHAEQALTAAEERTAETLALLNAEIEKHQWKPARDFPKPQYGTRALGLVNGRAVEVEFQYYAGWVELYGEYSAVDPTHIAPLPEAPRTEDGE